MPFCKGHAKAGSQTSGYKLVLLLTALAYPPVSEDAEGINFKNMLQKKLANLGTLLSRDAQKKIVGGDEDEGGGGGGGACWSDDDCLSGIWIECNGEWILSGPGRCYWGESGLRCHYSVGC